ncbi:FAD-dependent monooxygenase [Sinorhizobium fredii]|uniref:FAD-dependent monooxygenase n=1 Tax=Rhizobium fredii TaxID=380 RepID=UPI00069439DB|nr:FAD-dependent monooxygenase [Sinorhizobium fredii]WOS66025.1 FAD-dependent monooxygenase [Sinorhizobium fredii GR64]
MSALDTEVLIVGAGPTGLTLALWLVRLGVDIRLIDRSVGPGETSRALAVQARTLEFHRQIGVVDDVLEAGIRLEQLTARTPEKVSAIIPLSKFGEGVSRYSYAFALPQDIHERVLVAHLEEAGVHIERQTELIAFEEKDDGVTVTTRREGVTKTFRTLYICGCDGARSTVRHALGIGFPGGTYDQSFYVADVDGDGEVTRNGMDVCLGSYGFALVMPVRQTGSLRLIGVVPEAHKRDPVITFETIRPEIECHTGIAIKALNWFSTYRVHHRVAERFRGGRAFLLGDAGHIHSPAGGQGMNTGIGDAVNLAWKLAAVLQGRAAASLLDTYETERLAFARVLIKSTDQAFKLVSGRSWLLGLWRRYAMAKVISAITRTKIGSRAFFALISQTGIKYRKSALSSGRSGAVQGGDRLPWVPFGQSDNHACLTTLDWQVHVYGEIEPAFGAAISLAGIPLHRFDWSTAAGRVGVVRNTAYLVRPDGQIAIVAKQDATAFERFIETFAIKPRNVEASTIERSSSLAAI